MGSFSITTLLLPAFLYNVPAGKVTPKAEAIAIAIFILVDNILLICSNGLNNHDLKLTYSSKLDELMGQFL